MKWYSYRDAFPINYSRESNKIISEKNQVNISTTEHVKLETEARRIFKNPYQFKEQEEFIFESKKLTNFFDQTTTNNIKSILDSFGVVFIKNLPIDKDLPNTPLSGGRLPVNYKHTFISESLLIALGNITGSEPFNFRQEGFGSSPLIDNIVPVKKLANQKGAGGFRNNFPFHSESAWHRKRPDYLILLAQRGKDEAKTLVFSSSQLSEELVGVVKNEDFEKSFRLKAPDLYLQMESEGIPLGTDKYSSIPPIQPINGKLRLNINFNGIDSNSTEYLTWLHELEKYIEQHHYSVTLEKGTALIINNKITCHTRTGYEPLFNGLDRWLIRGYFKNDLWRSDRDQITEDMDKFNELGWIDDCENLSNVVTEFIESPHLLKNIDPEMKRLINRAMYLTPTKNSRIV